MIKKLTFHELVWYFFVFSIAGMFLENIFCFITSRSIESRKGFLIGPFCPIYGVGAILLIMFLEPHKAKKYKVFLYGMIVGASFEYFSSFAMQALYGTKFWDYPKYFLNINGRTCLFYAVSWGVLSLVLIYWIKPIIDKFIKLFTSKNVDKIILTFMLTDALITFIAINSFMGRVKLKYNNNIYKEGFISNKAMEVIFPNMVYVTKNDKKILIRKLME